jgi:hypothetical protein
MALPDLKEKLVPRVQPEPMVTKEIKANSALKVIKDVMALLGLKELRDLRVPQVPMETKATKES